MKKISLALFVSMLSAAGMSFAQSSAPTSEIRESTDPAKVSEVERHAQELQSRGQTDQSATSGSSATDSSGASGTSSKRKHAKKHSHKSKSKSSDTSGSSSGADSSSSSGGGTSESK